MGKKGRCKNFPFFFSIHFCSADLAKKTLTAESRHFAIDRNIGLSYALLRNQKYSNTLKINTHSMYQFEPQIQIRNNCAVHYYLPTVQPKTGHREFSGTAYSGSITPGAKKRILSAVDILVQCNPPKTIWNPITKKYFPFQVNLVTLTISNGKPLDSRYLYRKLMKPYLRIMRKFGNFSYAWKLEYQSDIDYKGRAKRYGGQLHYHIATNTFVPWQDIRSTWNNLQRKTRLLDDFAIKHKHFDPNSTDVHAVEKVKNIGSYLAKYLTKEGTKKVFGKVWDCSTDLKRKRFTFTPTNEQDLLLRKLQASPHVEVIELEHCTIFKGLRPHHIFTKQNFIDYSLWKC